MGFADWLTQRWTVRSHDYWRPIERFHTFRLLALHGLPPAFYGRPALPDALIPVFSQHGPGPKYLTPKLQHLADNGYEAVTTREYADWLAGNWAPPRPTVMLTFDDGQRAFAEQTFPVLRQFGIRSVLFVCPGLVDLASAADGPMAQWVRQTILTWKELEELHRTGLVDIQSHGMWHQRVSCGSVPQTVGVGQADNIMRCPDLLPPNGRLERVLAGEGREVPRFPSIAQFMQEVGAPGSAVYETVRQDLAEARRRIEGRFPGHRVLAFAFPWWNGSPSVLPVAREAGYELVFWGMGPVSSRLGRDAVDPLRIARLSFDWILCLPGRARVPVTQLLWQKLNGWHDERV
jgi:peptidoglycan/xylan/chitin deacetylase (PgdA/CDA1 family)